jgi:[acyl-carrier-protein] S-malonyltransferase
MAARGVQATVELGAGRVLTGLVKRTTPEIRGSALGTPEEIDAYIESLPAR